MLLNILQLLGQPLTTKNDLIQNVNRAKVEKPWVAGTKAEFVCRLLVPRHLLPESWLHRARRNRSESTHIGRECLFRERKGSKGLKAPTGNGRTSREKVHMCSRVLTLNIQALNVGKNLCTLIKTQS